MAGGSGGNENVWMHAGNLDWYSPASAVEEGLRSLLLTVLGSAESVETMEVMAFKNKKRKAVDDDKQHQGFALVKFSSASCARAAIEALSGTASELGRHKIGAEGERLALAAAPARDRVEKSRETQEREAAAAATRKAEMDARFLALSANPGLSEKKLWRTRDPKP